jgi:hypothetical protein
LPLIRIAFWNAVLFWGVPGVQTHFMYFYKEQCYAWLFAANLFVLVLVGIPLVLGWKLSDMSAMSRNRLGLVIGIGVLFCVHVIWTVGWIFNYSKL